MTTKTRGTTARGYGHKHQTQRRRLLYQHKDGQTCWWCNLPMYRDKAKNWDGKPLAADHDDERAATGALAGRLLHLTCNSQRQGGERDDQRPALTGRHPSTPRPQAAQLGPETTASHTTPPFTWG